MQRWHGVLILVLVESGLGERAIFKIRKSEFTVLILVLVESGLGARIALTLDKEVMGS